MMKRMSMSAWAIKVKFMVGWTSSSFQECTAGMNAFQRRPLLRCLQPAARPGSIENGWRSTRRKPGLFGFL